MSFLYANSQGFVRPNITEKDVTQYGVVAFGRDNTYPQQTSYALSRCGIATSCTKVLAEFIEGNGFADPLFANAIVNDEGDTANMLLAKTVLCLAQRKSFFWHIGYALNATTGKVAPYSVELLEYDTVRFSIPTDGKYCTVKVWDNWANASPRIAPSPADIVEIDLVGAYDLHERIEAVGLENYNGQVLYFSESGKINMPSAIEGCWDDVLAMGNLSEFGNNFIANGFSASTVIVDEGGNFADEAVRSANEQQIGKLGGVQSAGGIALLYGNLKTLDIASRQLDKDYEVISEAVKERIMLALGVNRLLIDGGRQGGGFANKDEIINAFKYMNTRTEKIRNAFSNIFKRVFSQFEYPANPSQDYTIVAQSFEDSSQRVIENPLAWEVLTTEEKRAYVSTNYDYSLTEAAKKPKESRAESTANESTNPEQATAQAQLRGSVGGVQGILSIADSFKRGIINEVSALTILEEIYGFSNVVAKDILGISPLTILK